MASSLLARGLPEPPGALLRLRGAAQELEEMKLWVAAVGSQDPHRILLRVLSVQRFRMRSLLGRGGTAG